MKKSTKVYLGIAGWFLSLIALMNMALWALSIKGSWGNLAMLAGCLLLIGAGWVFLTGITKGAELVAPPEQKDTDE